MSNHKISRLIHSAMGAALLSVSAIATGSELSDAIAEDYDAYLGSLFEHFHRNPELSLVEFETAARMADELRDAGFDVTTGVGGTGVVAMLENGAGPLIAMRADMDGLPVLEQSGLDYASTATQTKPNGNSTDKYPHGSLSAFTPHQIRCTMSP